MKSDLINTPVIPQRNTRQTHHITFYINPSTTEGRLILISPDASYSFSCNNGYQTDLEDGYYDLVFITEEMFSTPSVILDKFHVYQDMDTTFDVASASNKIDLQVKDENGNIILPVEARSGSGLGILITFTPGMIYPYTSAAWTGFGLDEIYCTELPQGMKILFSREELILADHYQQYVINYPILDHLSNDTLMTNESGDLHAFQHVFSSSPAVAESFFCWGYGPVGNSSMLGYIDTFVPAIGWNDSPSSPSDTVLYFTNHGASDSAIAFFVTFIDHEESDPMEFPSLGGILSPLTFLDVNDDLIMSFQGNFPPAKGDYRFHPGESVSIGNVPPYNVTWSYNPPASNIIHVSTHHRGPVNDKRYVDISQSTYQVWKDNLMLIYDTLYDFHLNLGFPSSGEYQLIVNDSNYQVFGVQGFQQTLLDFDLADPVDANPPTPIGLKILQGDRITQEVINGFDASVSFTAGDYETDLNTGLKYYHSLASAELYFKDHSSENWQSLDVTELTNELDSLAGMPYKADLWPVMNAFHDSVWVDLRLELTDPSGNICIQTISPAFLMRNVVTGTENFSNAEFSCYPNPVCDKLYITGSERLSVIVYNCEGKVLLQEKYHGSVDLSGFPAGIYGVRITTDGGKEVIRKIIKI